jgi:hypothetical protein
MKMQLLAAREDVAAAEAEDGTTPLLAQVASVSAGNIPTSGDKAGAAAFSFTDTDLLHESLTFILAGEPHSGCTGLLLMWVTAGQDTTSMAVVWSMYLLAKHPEWKAKAREQVSISVHSIPCMSKSSNRKVCRLPACWAAVQKLGCPPART